MTSRRLVAALFGVAMTATAAVGADNLGLVAVTAALIAILVGLYVRGTAPVAVLGAVCAVALTQPHPMVAAASGVCAAAYLVLTHAPLTRATAGGVAGFAAVGALATMVPASVPWLPLVGPLLVVAVVGVALRPFVDVDAARPTSE